MLPTPLGSVLRVNTSIANTGDDLAKAVPAFDRERLPDAHGLVDIESSFSKLVGNKFKAVLDLKFLKIVTHVVFGKRLGKSACPKQTIHFSGYRMTQLSDERHALSNASKKQ